MQEIKEDALELESVESPSEEVVVQEGEEVPPKRKRGRPRTIPLVSQPKVEVERIDLNTYDPNVICPFPVWGLPKAARELCVQGAKVYSVPVDVFAASVIGAIGAALRKKALWKNKYSNFPQLWNVIVAPSGAGKSEPLSIAFAPLEKLDEEVFIRSIKSEAQAQDAETKKGDRGFSKVKQILISDSTPEGLYLALYNNPEGLTLYRDELVGWLDDFGRYSKSGEVGQLLSIYSNKRIVINRKTEQPLLIDSPFLGVVGTIQPEVLAGRITRLNLVENGFAARLCYYFPDNFTKATKYVDTTLPQPLLKEYEDFILQLSSSSNMEFTADKEAMKVFKTFYSEMAKKSNDADDSFLSTLYAKVDVTVHRFALLVSAALYAAKEQESATITEATMRYAVEVCRYFVATGEKVQKLLGSNPIFIPNTKLIELLYERYNVASDTALATALGTSQQAMSKMKRKAGIN